MIDIREQVVLNAEGNRRTKLNKLSRGAGTDNTRELQDLSNVHRNTLPYHLHTRLPLLALLVFLLWRERAFHSSNLSCRRCRLFIMASLVGFVTT